VAGGVSEDIELAVEHGESRPVSMRLCSIKLAAQALFRDFMKASLLKTSEELEPKLAWEMVEAQLPRSAAAFPLPARLWPLELLLLGFPELPIVADNVISGPGDPPSPLCWLGNTRAFLRRGWYL